MREFLLVAALALVLVFCCGMCASGIDPPPLTTPTPTGATP